MFQLNFNFNVTIFNEIFCPIILLDSDWLKLFNGRTRVSSEFELKDVVNGKKEAWKKEGGEIR